MSNAFHWKPAGVESYSTVGQPEWKWHCNFWISFVTFTRESEQFHTSINTYFYSWVNVLTFMSHFLALVKSATSSKAFSRDDIWKCIYNTSAGLDILPFLTSLSKSASKFDQIVLLLISTITCNYLGLFVKVLTNDRLDWQYIVSRMGSLYHCARCSILKWILC